VVKMRLDGFLAQPVLCFEGKWLSRGAVIKYVANIASGVHSGTAETEEEKSLSRVRRAMTYAVEDRVTSFIFNPQALGGNTPPPLRYSPEAIDPAMVELLAAVRFLLESEDLATLEAIISAEINA